MTHNTEYTQGACIITLTAAAPLPKRRFVTATGSLCGDTAKAIGVNLYAADNGNKIGVITNQVVLVQVGTAVTTVGAAVTSDANGKVKPHSTGSINGYALATGVADDFIPILLK